MKIVFFMGSMCRGGAERVISIIANDYCARGWEVEIAVLLKNKVEYDLDERVRIVDLTGKHTSYIKNAAFWASSIRRYLKQTKPDRVVSFAGRINALVLTAGMGLGLPVVVSERNDPMHDGRSAMMRWYCDTMYRRAKAIVFQNRHEQGCFSAVHGPRSYIIPNPIRVTATREDRDFGYIITTAGRLTAQKNQKVLVSAMKQIYEACPQVKCRIYGEGELRQDLQAQIEALGLQDVVTLEGKVSDIHKRLAQCDLFVMTSDFEGLSNALIEAMMVGLPCISTDYPGANELIQDGENGLLVSCGDHDALAKAVIALMNDPGKMEQLARNAKQSAQQYNADLVLEQWREVIEMGS